MAAALDAGAAIVNEFTHWGSIRQPRPWWQSAVVRWFSCICVARRADMYAQARYADVAAEVARELGRSIAAPRRRAGA